MPDRLERLLDDIKKACVESLGDTLAGVYVHGSIAFGCFTWEKSDVDFLVVVHRPLTIDEKLKLMQPLFALNESAPPKGMEMSVVLLSDCREFSYPTPYELHYSNAYRDRCAENLRSHCERVHGTDKDLAAHFTVTRAIGMALYGPPAAEVFAPVPREAYVDSLLYDAAEARADITENPIYVILNLCRVLAYLREGCVLSKQQGGDWGLAHLPDDYHPLLQAALDAYAAKANAARLANYPLVDFADDMLARIDAEAKQD